MGGVFVITCVLLTLFLLPTSAIITLYTKEELSRTGYGYPDPRHGLKLLRWLAQSMIYFDNNGIMRARFRNDQYGFHYYGNYEHIFPALQGDQEYFEVGNLNSDGADALPDSVRAAYDQHQGNSYEYNMDRIVVQRRLNSNEIGAVYITEHSRWSGAFNSQNTFRISPALIRGLQSPFHSTPIQPQPLQFNNQALQASRFLVPANQEQIPCEGLCLCLLVIVILCIGFLVPIIGGVK